MLHITNGDAAASVLRRTGIGGKVLAWREMWTDGPARRQWDGAEALAERADLLMSMYGIPQRLYLDEAKSRIGRLREAARHGEKIVLWFEYDLFDQAMLASLLDGLWRWRIAEGWSPEVDLIVAGPNAVEGVEDFRGLGQLDPEQLAGLWPLRRRVTEAEQSAGHRAWEAFASPEPSALCDWMRTEGRRELPVMAEAMAFHLSRFPSTGDGLGVAERATLRALAGTESGAERPDRLFGRVGAELRWYGLADLSYWGYLDRMAETGLVTVAGSPPLPKFGHEGAVEWERWRVRMTALGREVLDGPAAVGNSLSDIELAEDRTSRRLPAGHGDDGYAGRVRKGGDGDRLLAPLRNRWLGGVPPQSVGAAFWRYGGLDREGMPEIALR